MTSLFAGGKGRSRTAHEYARDTIRKAILDGTLSAGTRLHQGQLATDLGVSTTPVREALRDLAAEGLIVFEPQRGAVVRGLRLEEVQEIYDLRMALDPLALRRSIDHLGPSVFDEAELLMEQMDAEDDTARWAQLNRQFHDLFIAPVAGTRLGHILSGLRDSASVYVGLSLEADPTQLGHASSEHRQFASACRARDIDSAVEITLTHLQATVDAIARAQTAAEEPPTHPSD
jgi:DNA-binding GntR family transcriptional regulator